MAIAMPARGAPAALAIVLASCSLETEGLWQGAASGGSAGLAGSGGAAGTAAGGTGWNDASTGGGAGSDASAGAAGADASEDTSPDVVADVPTIHCASYPGSAELVVNGSTHCYWLATGTAAQADAQAKCAEQGGYLATLVLQVEHDFVGALAQTKTVWLGMSRPAAPTCTQADYKWMTGEAAVFDGWDSNDPDCSGTGVAMVETSLWRDRDAATVYEFVCEVGPLLQ